MKRQITFKLDDTEYFSVLTKNYFTGTGFKTLSETNNQLNFVKGNSLLNMVTFNPLNWKSEVKVILTNDIVDAYFDINTVGQMVTPKEERLWDIFIENYKVSVSDKVDKTQENKTQLRETKRDSWKYVKHSLIGAIVFSVPSGLLAYYSGLDTLAPLGASIGAISFLSKKINEDRKKNAL